MPTQANRIIYFDILRAFAVLMMVQGHTIHTLLSLEYRTFDSIFYSIWFELRGFTAPIFMFTSGAVFTYLFEFKKISFKSNPRARKGLKRFFQLIIIAYLLRYPTWRLIDFSYVSESQWLTFFTVDALHLIAVGILSLILLVYISQRAKIKFLYLVLPLSMLWIVFTPFMLDINWGNYLPIALASYFTYEFGSYFPLFPWLFYMWTGGMVGAIIAEKPSITNTKRFSLNSFIIGIALIVLYYLSRQFIYNISNIPNELIADADSVLFRLGVVLLLNSAISFIALKIKNLNRYVVMIGRNTLVIYVVHLVILYGSAWFPGLKKYIGESFTVPQSLIAVALMFSLMFVMIIFVEKIKHFIVVRKKLLAEH